MWDKNKENIEWARPLSETNGSELFKDFVKIIPLVDKVGEMANRVSDILDMWQRKKHLKSDIIDFAVALSDEEYESWGDTESNFDLFRRFLCDKQGFNNKDISELRDTIEKLREGKYIKK